jgi:hypothetical protein
MSAGTRGGRSGAGLRGKKEFSKFANNCTTSLLVPRLRLISNGNVLGRRISVDSEKTPGPGVLCLQEAACCT